MNDNSFEKFPGSNIESQGERPVSPEQDFAKSETQDDNARRSSGGDTGRDGSARRNFLLT